MYFDAFDHHPDHGPPPHRTATPTRWPRRALGLALLGLLVLMHACG